MILCRGQWQSVNTVGQHKETRLFALKKFFNHAFRTAKAAGEDIIKCCIGFGQGHGDCDTFAGSQSIRLDHDRRPSFSQIGAGLFQIREAAIGGGGDVVFRANVLGETFGAFELGRKF